MGVEPKNLDMAILARVVNKEIPIRKPGIVKGQITKTRKKFVEKQSKIKSLRASVKALKSKHKKNPAKTERTKKARTKTVKAINTTIKDLEKQAGEDKGKLKVLRVERDSPTGNALQDALLTSEALMLRTMGFLTRRQDAVVDEFLVSFNRGEFQFRPDFQAPYEHQHLYCSLSLSI